MKKAITRVENAGCFVAAVVGDNAANVQACIREVVQKMEGLVGLRCAAHSFQLLLEDVCKVLLLLLPFMENTGIPYEGGS